MEDRAPITPLDAEFTFKSGTAMADYKPAPVKKLLKANITAIDKTEQPDTYEKLPSGQPNPKFGKMQTKFIFKFKLNDPAAGEANGQVYTAWVSSAVSDKSNLGKVSDAVWGSWDAILQRKAGDFIGQPLQLVLKAGTKDPNKLVVDIDKLMPAADGQEVITPDVVLADVPEGGISVDELNDVFK